MPTDYDALLALAKAATPGPYEAIQYDDGFWGAWSDALAAGLTGSMQRPDAEFYAACSPDVVTALVDDARELRELNSYAGIPYAELMRRSAKAREGEVISHEHMMAELREEEAKRARLATLEAAARAAKNYLEEYLGFASGVRIAFDILADALDAPPQEGV